MLHDHCRDVGRDPHEVEITTLGTVLTASDEATLDGRLDALTPPDGSRDTVAGRVGAGTVDEQIGRFRGYAEVGVGTAIVNLPAYGRGGERVAELAPLVAAFR